MSSVGDKNIAKIQTTYVHQQEIAEIASARKRKLLFRRLSLFLVFAALMSYLMITSFISQSSTLDKKVAQKKQLEQQMTQLKKQQEILKEDIVKLNDDDYLAKLARKEYFFSENGEIIFNIPEENKGKNNQ
ncbi:septum formation initiator family protein [Neobacillus sp. YX16]|uniref:FtsB family cell division protein n=1 Tax=Bacillaceae TaxID=186817 RepID=UPI000BA730B9|nr:MULTISPECIES: septum formation initiator family protein [Bacillaceae]PAE36805.1 cell division protein DIVIC [Bacillus sp. 7884-1]TDL60288.1 septum formation initiator family protein [Rhodococcus qingshengii]WHZ03249.1 septum formation initiator family protein [Neobacillus sp. YX16]